MNSPQKHIAELLITGCYLMQRQYKKGERFILFKGNMQSVSFVKERHLRPLKSLLKKDKMGRFTLNLSEVRKLDGRTFLKKLYKKNHAKNHSHFYKQNNKYNANN